MKILIYTHEYPPFAGGAGEYSRNLANGLAALGVDVYVCTEWRGAGAPAEPVAEETVVQYLRKDQLRGSCAALAVIKLWLQEKFDVVLVTEFQAHLNLAKYAHLPFPYISVLHGSEFLSYFRNGSVFGGVTIKRFLRYLNRSLVVTGSHATAAMIGELLLDRRPPVKVVHYGIDVSRFHVEKTVRMLVMPESFKGEDISLLLCVGRVHLDKGHDVLLKAFANVLADFPNARLAIVGDGSLMNEMVMLRDELQLQNTVHFAGKVTDAERIAWYQACDVFVMPSRCEKRWEGMGLVYLEANLFVKPCIGGCEGGVPEAIDHENTGLIVDPRDPDAVAEAILRLLREPDYAKRLGAAGQKRVKEYFNHIRMARETLDVVSARLRDEGITKRIYRMISLLPWAFIYMRNRLSS